MFVCDWRAAYCNFACFKLSLSCYGSLLVADALLAFKWLTLAHKWWPCGKVRVLVPSVLPQNEATHPLAVIRRSDDLTLLWPLGSLEDLGQYWTLRLKVSRS